MGRSDTLLMFVGSDDVLEIPRHKEPLKPIPKPKPKPELREQTSRVIRCSAEAYTTIAEAACVLRVPLARVVDCMVEHFTQDPNAYEAILNRFGH